MIRIIMCVRPLHYLLIVVGSVLRRITEACISLEEQSDLIQESYKNVYLKLGVQYSHEH